MISLAKRFRKEISILAAFIGLVLGVSTYVTYLQLNQLLSDTYVTKLSVLKNALDIHVKSYFETKNNIVITAASSHTTAEAIAAFEKSFNAAQKERPDQADTEVLRKSITMFLSRVRYDVPSSAKPRKLEAYIPKSDSAKILQNFYIAQNPFGTHERHRLFSSGKGLSYDGVHNRYHDFFLTQQQLHGFYDIFLIDNSGNVIYSVFKEFDFAVNLKEGVYADSSLAQVYKKALAQNGQKVVFSDFKPYIPSYNKPAAFMATPVFDKGKKVGVIAFQIPIGALSAAMTLNHTQKESGLGESGEAYLVGSDYYMRSDSRFVGMMEDKLVNDLGTSIGIIKVQNSATEAALLGENGSGTVTDYRGKEVFCSYMPLPIFDTVWAVIVEIDTQEVRSNINNTVITLLLASMALIVLFLALLGYMVLRMIVKPIKEDENLLAKNIRAKDKELIMSEALLDEYKKAVDISSIVSKTNNKGIITYVNDAFCDISGYSREELIGKSHRIVRHPDMPAATFEEMWRMIVNKQPWKGVIRNLKKDGGDYFVKSTIIPILDEHNEIMEFISIRSDITDLVKKERKLRERSTDSITQLPNRVKLLEDIAKTIGNIKLSIIQLKKFKEINEFYGTEIGDSLLISITAILKGVVPEKEAVLYKIGSDEFAVLETQQMNMDDFLKKMANIIKHFDHSVIKVSDNSFHTAMTIGLASSGKNKIFFNAEMALSKAVETSQSLLVYEDSHDIEKQYQENIRMTTIIKEAIRNDGIIVYAQPIISNSGKGKNKYECLVRLYDGTKVLSPFFFLEIAKKNRLYPTITRIVIEKSFECFQNKTEEFSINLSIEDILNPEIVSFLKQKIAEYKVGHRLVLELIESEGIENFDEVNLFIQEAKALGCKIAIDDFGTGYSNFEYLMKLHVDYIKIDGSLIKNIHTDSNSQVIVELIVEFAKRMEMMTIAEFVHCEEVQTKVKALGIDYSQGYFLGEPSECTRKQG